jgi:hypothetical protein
VQIRMTVMVAVFAAAMVSSIAGFFSDLRRHVISHQQPCRGR